MARSGARADVELVEDDDVTADAPPLPAATRTHDGRDDVSPTTRRRAVSVGAALLAVLVVVGLVGQTVVTSRERDRVAALAGVAGVVDPIDGPVQVVRTGADRALLQAGARTRDGLLVVHHEEADGRAVVRAVDPVDDRVGWETELIAAGSAHRVPQGVEPVLSGGGCVPAGTDDHLLVCVADNAVSLLANGTLARLAPTDARLVVLDGRDGTVVRDLSDAAPRAALWSSVAVLGDLVVAAGTDGSTTRVRATTVEGRLAWETSFPSTSTTAYGAQVRVTTTDDGVVVSTTDRLRLLDASGRTLQEATLTPDQDVQGTSGASVVLGSVAAGSTLVVGPGGSRTVPGRWIGLTVDDGSAPGLVLTADADGLHAWSPDGTQRWTVDRPAAQRRSALLLAGRLVLGDATAVVMLDAATGEQVWRTDGLLPGSGIVTDGRHVLVLAGREGRSMPRELVALDATDGGTTWRVALPTLVDVLTSRLGVLTAVAVGGPDDDGSGIAVTVLR